MPKTCCAPHCRGNYDRENKVSLFRFPKNLELSKMWTHRLMRKDFKPTEHSRVCERHFRIEDIVRESTAVDNKTGKVISAPLSAPRLKEGAVPVFLPGCASYLEPSTSLGPTRTSPNKKNILREMSHIQQAISDSKISKQKYDERRTFNSLEELKSCIKEETFAKWTILDKKDKLFFLNIQCVNVPEIVSYLCIGSNLLATASIRKISLDALGKFSFPLKVNSINSLCDMLFQLHSLTDEDKLDKEAPSIIKVIEFFLTKLLQVVSADKVNVIKFIAEQLNNIMIQKERYRYSADCMIFASLMFSISPHAYKFCRKSHNFILPHPGTIQRVCSRISVNPKDELVSQNFLSYVKQKFSGLNDNDKTVIMLADEIHIKPYFEYVGGTVMGMAYDSTEAASSAYVFMLQSMLSGFKEVAHILPVRSFNATALHCCIKNIIIGLEHIGFRIIGVVTDNNSINRKAMSFFSASKTQNNVVFKHPFDPSRPLFFFIDSVHLLKCIRNNWLNQRTSEKCMYFPDFDDFSKVRTASFSTLKKLHEAEVGSLLKFSYGLSLKALCPSNIERQNVSLALQIFNKNVAEGLVKLENKISAPHCESTAKYIKLICDWWDIFNVKSVLKGQHSRNKYQNPLTIDEDDANLVFIDRFIQWLDHWNNLKFTCGILSKETHSALRQTCYAMIELTRYCIEELNFKYILPGKVQTDSLEHRFGQYRQLAGAQYHISIRQLYECESKLRLQHSSNLLFKSPKCGNLVFSPATHTDDWEEMDVCGVSDFDISVTDEDISSISSALPILMYIAGYCSYAAAKRLKCIECRDHLCVDKVLEIPNDDWIKVFDRGGLCYPHPDVLSIVIHTYIVVEKITSSDMECLFLKVTNHRAVVCSITLSSLYEKDYIIGTEECSLNHKVEDIVNCIVWASTNILLNNYRKNLNDKVSGQSLKKRKMQTFHQK